MVFRIAAMQAQESVRELVRKLAPQQLRHGDGQNAGLMLLVQLLAKWYAPLEIENATKGASEFLSFRRMPGKSIVSVLVRYDILRSRAQHRAGLMISITGLAWLLLQALQLNVPLNDFMDRIESADPPPA